MMERYRALGIKLTPQRLAILKCLEGNETHPSAEDIYREVRKAFPTMSFATVYNTLEVLRAKGGVNALSIDPDRMRYDPDTSSHHHLICTACKRVVDVRARIETELSEDETQGFELTGSHVEFYGLCPKCRDRE
ncbi:MAG: Fur family transcriptional regulator [Nitrospirota bacterium]|jgi:Fur family peroxide stress response transcriptional regulator